MCLSDSDHLCLLGCHRVEHFICVLSRREYEKTSDHGAKDCAESIERLGKIYSLLCASRVTQYSDIRIGSCFKKAKSASNDEQRGKKESINAYFGRGVKQCGSQSK